MLRTPRNTPSLAVLGGWLLVLFGGLLPMESRAQAPAADDSVGVEVLPYRLVVPRDAGGVDRSGDGQSVHVGETAAFSVKVVDESGRGVPGVLVRFERADDGPRILGAITSDEQGLVEIAYPVGEVEGAQTVLARIVRQGLDAPSLLLRVYVRSPGWVFAMVLGLAGGLALFLLGMESMSGALRRSAGSRLRTVLAAFTRNRFVGVIAGAVVTMLIQSSSATTVLLVSFVQAGLLSFARTLGVILGADIGTTATVQLIAFQLTDLALPTIAIGFLLRYVLGRPRLHETGEALLGFGLLFLGLSVMGEAMGPLRSYAPLVDQLHTLKNPVLGILVGTLFTGLIHSSAAFIGIVIVLSQQGLIGLEQGIPLLFGANIGTCITAVLASLRGSRAAKRVAVAHVAFKVGGVLLVAAWIPAFAQIVRDVSGYGEGAEVPATAVPRLIANAHTLFNVGLAVVFLPFTSWVAAWVEKMLPDRPVKVTPVAAARFLDPQVLRTPALALSLAKVEILDLGRRVQRMADDILQPLLENDVEALDRIHAEEKRVDALDEQINEYLLKIGSQNIGREQSGEVYLMLHVSVMLENMADVLDKELRKVARKRIKHGIHFSPRGRAEIEAYHLKMLKQISRALEAFSESSLETAHKVTQKQAKYDHLEVDYRRKHFERLQEAVSESVESNEIHLDVMDGLQKISNHATNIARAMLAREAGENGEGPVAPQPA